MRPLPRGAMVIETFGCELPAIEMASAGSWLAVDQPSNTSAEDHVERSYGLRSQSCRPRQRPLEDFLLPGFTTRTGGLMVGFSSPAARTRLSPRTKGHPQALLFCYEARCPGLGKPRCASRLACRLQRGARSSCPWASVSPRPGHG